MFGFFFAKALWSLHRCMVVVLGIGVKHGGAAAHLESSWQSNRGEYVYR
jgi:hypothetical protein